MLSLQNVNCTMRRHVTENSLGRLRECVDKDYPCNLRLTSYRE